MESDTTKSRDRIISAFQGSGDNKRNVGSDVIKSLVDQQAKEPGALDKDISFCTETLNIYTELLKIEMFLEKTWDIKILGKSVLVKFELSEVDRELTDNLRETNGNRFYKDIALKCIKKCDKLSLRLQHLQTEAAAVREYVASMQSRILEDSITLLLELWFTCKAKLSTLKNRIAGVFINSKLLLIDLELEQLKNQLSIRKDYVNVIPAYRSFMKILVEQLQDAQTTNDQSLFDECLHVFIDVEAMYNSMNFNWLLAENKLLQESLSEADAKNHATTDPFVLDSLLPSPTETSNSDPELRSRSSSASVPMSNSTDLSLMLEKTQLSKELPSLLATFNNAKRMEQEIESIRTAPVGTASNLYHSPNNVLPSTNNFKTKLMMMNQQQSNLWNQFMNTNPHYGSGNHILNNLYGMNNNNSTQNKN